MHEQLNKDDRKDYRNSDKHEYKNTINKMVNVTKQYLLHKNNIIEILKDTPLLPYLLEMEYLVGVFEDTKVTDSPEITLHMFQDKGVDKGVTSLMQIEMNEKSIQNWNVFRLIIKIKNKYDGIDEFSCFLFLQIKEKVNYFLFSYYNDKVYSQEVTLTMLDKQPSIKKTREMINDASQPDQPDEMTCE